MMMVLMMMINCITLIIISYMLITPICAYLGHQRIRNAIRYQLLQSIRWVNQSTVLYCSNNHHPMLSIFENLPNPGTIHLSIHLLIHPYIHVFIHQTIHLFLHSSFSSSLFSSTWHLSKYIYLRFHLTLSAKL
jgi:hypothetical protein